MAPPDPHVKYDFAAADHLSWALWMLKNKIDWLVWLRNGQRSSLLGEKPCDNWSGARRTKFERQFAAEQQALKNLATEAEQLWKAVGWATEQANAKRTGGIAT